MDHQLSLQTSRLEQLPPELRSQIIRHTIEVPGSACCSFRTQIDLAQAVRLSIASVVSMYDMLASLKRLEEQNRAHRRSLFSRHNPGCSSHQAHYNNMLRDLIHIIEPRPARPSGITHQRRIPILRAFLPCVGQNDLQSAFSTHRLCTIAGELELDLFNVRIADTGPMRAEVRRLLEKSINAGEASAARLKALNEAVSIVRTENRRLWGGIWRTAVRSRAPRVTVSRWRMMQIFVWAAKRSYQQHCGAPVLRSRKIHSRHLYCFRDCLGGTFGTWLKWEDGSRQPARYQVLRQPRDLISTS